MATTGPSAPPEKLIFKLVTIDCLRSGYQLGSQIRDAEGLLLLGAGMVITEELLERLRERGVTRVSIDKRDLEKLNALNAADARGDQADDATDPREIRTEATEQLDKLLDAHTDSPIAPAVDPYSDNIKSHGDDPYSVALMSQQVAQHCKTVDQIGALVSRLNEAESIGGEKLQSISHESIVQAAEDMDLFVSLGISGERHNSIFERSANVSRLAVAIGAYLGQNEEQLCHLGAGCLVHDAGLLRVEEKLRRANRTLNDADYVDLARHPIYAADMLYESMSRVPVGVRMIVYQMHERCDGSGYPRGVRASQIHPLARIASVADAYIDLISPSDDTLPLAPYDAMRSMLEAVGAGQFDAQVIRGLLEAVSLFPIGSFVELSDGRVGKVLRSNGAAYDLPVVETWDRQALDVAPQIADLQAQSLRVTRALDELG